MDRKKIVKTAGRSFGRLSLNIVAFIVGILPFQCLYRFAEGIAWLGYNLVRKHRNIAIESLNVAFGRDKTKKELQQIARDCFTAMAKSTVEIIFLMDRPDLLKQRVQLVRKENLDKALAGKKGVILVSAHFGSFPLLLARLGLEGYSISGIMRQMRDSQVERMFLRKRQRFNVQTIYSQPRQACVQTTITKLRNNELVFIPLDQNFGTAGVFVDFFGQKAATATGPVIFSQRTQAALLPCFIIRQEDDTHKVFFEPELKLEEGRTPQETILLNIQRLTDIIEQYIRRYPAQWGWIHRRWKSKPRCTPGV